MDIALLHYAAPPIVGGVEHILGEHANLMAEAGHRVRIIAGRGASIDERIAFHRLPLADSRNPEILEVKSKLDAGTVPATFEVVVNRIKKELLQALAGADVLIAHNVCSLNKNLPLTAAVEQLSEVTHGPRVVLWHHDLAWTTRRYQPELHPGYPWDLLRSACPGASQVCVSEWRRQELSQLAGVPPELIRVIPNGLDPFKILKMDPRSRQIAIQLNLMDANPLILLPVRITPRKNVELAIRAVTELRKHMPQVTLLVTGPLGAHNPANVEYLARLASLQHELQAESIVHILAAADPEPLSDAAIADLYGLADVLLLTSTEEGFGIPILEAGLAGIPVFCTDIPPLRELGGSDVNYFTLDAAPTDIAKWIFSSLQASPGYALRKRVLKDYTWKSIYARHLAPLLEALRR